MSQPQNTPAAGGGIDMSQFFRVFFDEAAEHLATMESLLLAIDPAAAGDEDLNAIFRAAQPSVPVYMYEGAPHGLFLTDPQRFNRDVSGFARS